MLLCHEFHKRKFVLPDREMRKRRGQAQPVAGRGPSLRAQRRGSRWLSRDAWRVGCGLRCGRAGCAQRRGLRWILRERFDSRWDGLW